MNEYESVFLHTGTIALLNIEFDDKYPTKHIHLTLTMIRIRYLVQKKQLLCCERFVEGTALRFLNIANLLQPM
jgi:hypothetical protein